MAERERPYSEDEKRQAVRAYLMHGTYAAAEAALGIAGDTISSWKHRDPVWWDRTLAELSMDVLKDLADADQVGLRRIRARVIELLERRLETGDQKLNVKTGELVRVEIPAKELAAILPIVGGAVVAKEDRPKEKTEEERMTELAAIAEADREGRAPVN